MNYKVSAKIYEDCDVDMNGDGSCETTVKFVFKFEEKKIFKCTQVLNEKESEEFMIFYKNIQKEVESSFIFNGEIEFFYRKGKIMIEFYGKKIFSFEALYNESFNDCLTILYNYYESLIY